MRRREGRPAGSPPLSERDVIFISHATPDDNEFVRWLGTRLTGYGYKVWADIFDLAGGTPFWISIEDAIRKKALKVVFVVSKASCHPDRSGVRNEISVADTVRKALKDPEFIVPVRIDDVAFGDLPIQIHQLNTIDFTSGWGAKLADLVDTLTKAGVPRVVTDLTAEFDRWRQASVRSDVVVERGEESLLTSILPIVRLPEEISFYEYEGENRKFEEAVKNIPHPLAWHNRLLVSFAAVHELQQHLPAEFTVALRASVPFPDFLQGAVTDPIGPHRRDASNAAVRMLRESFERHLAARGLLRYEASAGTVMFFPKDLLPDDRVIYTNAKGRQTYKQVVGFSKVLNAHWHLAMRPVIRLDEAPSVRLRPFVVFTRDGREPLKDADEMTKLRRRFCKSWFNHVWRPLFQAFYEFFGDGNAADAVRIDLGEHRSWAVAGEGMKLVGAMRMPLDLGVLDTDAEPDEPDEDDIAEDEDAVVDQ
ncbi:TIR domain-containing protein [Bradyrhizobium canariense]|nr:TIR domain-containing protein [Bradyrhizobium canariense]OSI48068.1 TIR domain-containing protein [Bradyrhizobium canariense]OSI48634.1 TIR domain-containing protein [Bradyrhizobium canariense]OSI58592.1 TIR domain-containing protein [Bradyrhizobium canariense]